MLPRKDKLLNIRDTSSSLWSLILYFKRKCLLDVHKITIWYLRWKVAENRKKKNRLCFVFYLFLLVVVDVFRPRRKSPHFNSCCFMSLTFVSTYICAHTHARRNMHEHMYTYIHLTSYCVLAIVASGHFLNLSSKIQK